MSRNSIILTAILITNTAIFISVPLLVSAIEPTKTATPSPQVVEKEIKNLKDKIATKVAELRKKNLKAIAGSITEVTDTLATVKTSLDQLYKVKIDKDLTKLYSVATGQKKDLKSADLKKGIYIIASGPLAEKEVSANVIYQDSQYIVKTGKITEINKDDSYLKVLSSDKDSYTLDIETSTKLQMLDSKTLEVESTRLLKMKEGDTIHFVVEKTGDEKEPNRYSADKVLIVPQEYFIK